MIIVKKIKNNKRKLALIIFFCLGIILALFFIYQSYRVQNDFGNTGNIPSYLQQPVSYSRSAETIFIGKHLEATLPSDWSIIELEGADGMLAFTQGTIVGLSGFEIQYKNQKVFSIKGVEGVGAGPLCGEVYRFDDTSEEYINLYRDYVDAPARVIDLRNTSYSDINLFGRELRRIVTTLYWNQPSEQVYFNPMCGFGGSFIQIPKLEIEILRPDGSTSKNDLFKIQVSTGHSEADLQTLDQILNSVELLKVYTNQNLPELVLKHPSSWSISVKEFTDNDSKGFKSKYFNNSPCDQNCMGIKLSKQGVSLTMIFDLAYDSFGKQCSNLVEYKEVGNGWLRIKSSIGYSYHRNYEFNVMSGPKEFFAFGNSSDEWSLVSNTNYKVCINGSGHFRSQKANVYNSPSEPGTFVEFPIVEGNPTEELLQELDEIIKTLN